MDVRDMKGNPSIWEELSWSDLSMREKDLWSMLGWNENAWDGNRAPSSADKAWNDLSTPEQVAAMSLGFTEQSWDSTEDE